MMGGDETPSLPNSLTLSSSSFGMMLSLSLWSPCSRSGMGNRRKRRCLLHYLTMDFW